MPRKVDRNNSDDDTPQGPPGWIVSFSDMVTLLLAFFVLLQSFATIQDPELFYVGQGSFRRAISGLGIPKWVYGKEWRIRREHAEVKHPTKSDPDNPAERRVIDPKDNEIRRLFEQIAARSRSRAEDVEQTDLAPAGPSVRFVPGAAELPRRAEAQLRDVARALVDTVDDPDVEIYVVGLAPDAGDAGRRWVLSTRRAEAVAAVIRDELAQQNLAGLWAVRPLGAAGGNDWCRRKFGLTRDGSHVGIAAVAEGLPHGR